MMDILGFREMLKAKPPEKIAEEILLPLVGKMPTYWVDVGPEIYEELTDYGKELGLEQPKVALMSDSILAFFPINDSPLQTFGHALAAATGFILTAIQVNSPSIWLRGAISYGDVWISNEDIGLSFIGPAIAEAYEWEHYQDWIGAILAPSAATKLDEALEQSGMNEVAGLCKYKAPLKIETEATQYCLDLNYWMLHGLTCPFFTPPDLATNKIDDKSIVRKYRNTIDFFEWCKAKPFGAMTSNDHS